MTTKIAAVQMDVALGDVDANLASIRHYGSKAAEQGAELVLFPECALTGYCFKTKEAAMAVAAAAANSSSHSHIDALQEISRDLGVPIIAGSLERRGDDLFNIALCVGPDGLVGRYRKTHLPALGVDHFVTQGALDADDEAYAVIQVGELRVGMLICYDASFPEASRILALKGADMIVLPTNWPPGAEPTADYVINARASENKIYFAAVNRIGHESGFDFIGKSKICDVHGNTIVAAEHRHAEILFAEIDPEPARDKLIVRVKGHSIHRFDDRRPDLYGEIL